MRKTKESEIHIGIMDWVRDNQEEHEVLKTIYHTPNSFFGTSYAVINWLKKLGLKKGVWDICIPIDNGIYPFAYLEVKSESGKLSKDQIEFRQLIFNYSNRFPIFVEIKSVDDGIEFIKKYLELEQDDDE